MYTCKTKTWVVYGKLMSFSFPPPLFFPLPKILDLPEWPTQEPNQKQQSKPPTELRTTATLPDWKPKNMPLNFISQVRCSFFCLFFFFLCQTMRSVIVSFFFPIVKNMFLHLSAPVNRFCCYIYLGLFFLIHKNLSLRCKAFFVLKNCMKIHLNQAIIFKVYGAVASTWTRSWGKFGDDDFPKINLTKRFSWSEFNTLDEVFVSNNLLSNDFF